MGSPRRHTEGSKDSRDQRARENVNNLGHGGLADMAGLDIQA
jgi:hypothetical protein